ncbi:MAG: NADH:flavin oxidoreductase [Oceanicoccus sp.]
MTNLFEPVSLGKSIVKNRFFLAPLTNTQSHPDGSLSEDEYHWLTMRAKGGFGMTMTCAAHVQAVGQGFPGQLGIFSDDHLEGLTRLANGIKAENSLAIVQLHHAGMRTPAELIDGRPVCPSDHDDTGSRGLSTKEVEQLTEDFVAAAERAEKAGFDGVELHGAHGYILCQFLSPTINQRQDQYGGSLENRSRIVVDIIDGIRKRCSPDFVLGVRLSPERFDVKLAEIRQLAQQLMASGSIDFLDMSLWDVFKEPAEEAFQGRSLASYFTELDRGDTKLGFAGSIRTPADAQRCLDLDVDFIMLGRAGILHHDFPEKMNADLQFQPVTNPVSADHLKKEGLGESFITYMSSWKGFVKE